MVQRSSYAGRTEDRGDRVQFLIDANHRDGAVRLRLRGELDLAAVPRLSAAIEDALAVPAPCGLVLDLGEVTFLDCATLGALMQGRAMALDRGRPYQVTGARGLPRRVMELTGLLAVLDGGEPG
jgi:anti-anti-sigma factor